MNSIFSKETIAKYPDIETAIGEETKKRLEVNH